MNIEQRVRFALIGFNGLFANSTEFSFENVIAQAVAFAREEEGLSGNPTDPQLINILVTRACINALEPIESIMIQMPTRRRMEVGVEVENADIKKMISALRSSYEKRYEKLEETLSSVNTFVVKNGIEAQEPIIIPFQSMLEETE